MKSLFNKLFSKSRNSIPKEWMGVCIDKTGRTIDLAEDEFKNLTVSVKDNAGNYYLIELLDNSKKETRNLQGRFTTDGKDNSYLELEAGENGLGPTYQLNFITVSGCHQTRLAKDTDYIDKLRIRPNVGLGLYADWDDDLGVPWAFPLEDYKKKNVPT